MSDFFYCSEECARDDLPVGCKLVRYLAVEGMQKKAAVIETEHPIYRSQSSSFVVLAKGIETVDDIFSGKLVGVYLMPIDQRAGMFDLNLSAGLQPVKDWGALTLTWEAAEWQVK
ncbi:MAG TPA: hypothetical protein VIM63_03875 [Rhodoferax sp.]